MVFSSLVFLLAFLPLNLFVYSLVPKEWRNQVLLAFSLVFYAWGGVEFLLVLLADCLVSWFFALLIQGQEDAARRRALLVCSLVLMLGLLGVFKYTGFFLGNIKAVLGVPEVVPSFVLPIGISFYTFQLVSYVVDVYRRDVPAQPKFWKLLLYASLFHQCIAGPIVRYETVANEIDRRKFTPAGMFAGIRRFSVGLAKKAVLANACASVADGLLPSGADALMAQPGASIWLGMACYMLQIYLDFSAYSDMAIGLGRMVGFHYLENFNYPYLATSVQDFWRRWHISLSTFFRDYVYIPLGGSRCSRGRYVFNLFVVWSLTGFWHGASWNFILWGLYFFVFLLLERFVIRGRMPKWLGHVYALVVVYFGWVLFRFTDSSELLAALATMLGMGKSGMLGMQAQTALVSNVFLIALSVVACTDLGKRLRGWAFGAAADSNAMLRLVEVVEVALPVLLVLVSIVALVGNSYNPFLYFRF